MRKNCLVLAMVAVLSTLITGGCSKNNTVPENTCEEVVKTAKDFFTRNIANAPPVIKDGNNRNPRSLTAKDPLWDQAYVTAFQGGQAVVVPLHFQKDRFIKISVTGQRFFNLANLTRLLLYMDSSATWHAELVTSIPDSSWLQVCHGPFTGMAVIEDWWGNPLRKFLYSKDGTIMRYTPAKDLALSNHTGQVNSGVISNIFIAEETCYSIVGYNYPGDDPANGYAWSEDLGCTYDFSESGGGGGGYGAVSGSGSGGTGGSSGTGPSPAPVIPPPNNVIANITDYLKCFANNADPSATYTVTVCVDQPRPNTRTPWIWTLGSGSSGGPNFVGVGHTFLVLTQVSAGGTVTRNVGFYPSHNVDPFNSSAPGVLNDDEDHPYDISGSYTVNSAMFNSILAFVQTGNNPGYNYDVNSNNCTTFVINAMAAGHIYLPSTYGSWPGGLGNDPGDLGEDIRGYDFTGMTRSTVDSPHGNTGSCN